MQTEDLRMIEQARMTIEEIVTAHYFGVQPSAQLGATDFAALPPHMQEAEHRITEENEANNRLRVGLHMCLSAASVALQVSETLMNDFAALSPDDRARALLKCSEDAMAAADAARHAAAVLSGEELPATEAFFDTSQF